MSHATLQVTAVDEAATYFATTEVEIVADYFVYPVSATIQMAGGYLVPRYTAEIMIGKKIKKENNE